MKKNLTDKLTLFPNPAQNILQIELNGLEVLGTTLFTIQGKEIPVNKTGQTQLDISYLPQGIYFLKVITNEGTILKKWVKE